MRHNGLPDVLLPKSACPHRALRGELREHRLDHSLVQQPGPYQPCILWLGEWRAEVREVGKGKAPVGFGFTLPTGDAEGPGILGGNNLDPLRVSSLAVSHFS